jgi:hypothetical protein
MRSTTHEAIRLGAALLIIAFAGGVLCYVITVRSAKVACLAKGGAFTGSPGAYRCVWVARRPAVRKS